MISVYLDNCMFNRPFDDQSYMRIRLEAEAKLYIQHLIKQQKILLVWSYILEFENSKNPFWERKNAIQKWKNLAVQDISESPEVLKEAHFFMTFGIQAKDALHAACASVAQVDYFLSTDDKLLKKLSQQDRLKAITPMMFIEVLDDVDRY